MSAFKKLFATILALQLGACATVTITERGEPEFLYRPHFEESKHFFLWGLIGEHTIDTQKICGPRPVVQMQTRFEPMDVLYAGLTLGLYLPRTAKVWCERNIQQ